MSRPFHVVTHRRWLVEAFAGYGAIQDFGHSIDPDTAEQTLWWAPGAWVACAWQSGIRLPLTSCGHFWMETLPYRYKRRDIVVRRIDLITNKNRAEADEMVHVKLPEAKLDSFPARLYHRQHLADTLRQHHVPERTMIQVSQAVTFVMECRFWIAHGRITAHSWYLVDGLLWDADTFMPGPHTVLARMENLVRELLTNATVPTPPGFVLDIGLTDDDKIVVVEANAAWSSAPYNGDPGGIIESITAAHDFGNQHPQWRWRPNPVYGRVQPIKHAAPAGKELTG